MGSSQAIFEFQLDTNSSFTSYKDKIFFVWNGFHSFFAWKNYIDRRHTEDYERHVFVNFIILVPQVHDIQILLIAMHDINK